MSLWWIELITNGSECNTIEIDARWILKLDSKAITIDGVLWTLPDIDGMTFADVIQEEMDDFNGKQTN